MNVGIAIAGKGGTGKITITSLITRNLIDREKGTILALDADANSNLNEVLGVKVLDTVGSMREDFKKNAAITMTQNISKEQMVEMNVQQSVIEEDGFDLLAMGRGEGPGCYCYANNIFRKYIDVLQGSYDYIIMDNEAGMEHLSRRTTQDIKYLLIISDPSPRGILTASRIRDLAIEMKINMEKSFLIVSRLNGDLDKRLKDYIEKENMDLIGTINNEDNLYEMDISGGNIFDIPKDSAALKQIDGILKKINI